MTVTNLTPPTVSGTLRVGQTLTSTPGTWDFDDDYLTYVYQWERCDSGGGSCADIAGAAQSTYKLVTADIGSTLRLEVTATEHVNPGGGASPIPSNGYISAAGTYGGNFAGQITIATQAPVVLDGAVLTYTGGTIIKTQASNPPDLTLVNCFITGASHRLIDCDAFNSITMWNCTIVRTAGITLVGNGDVSLLRNRHTNIQRVSGGVGNFIQFRLCQSGSFEVGWNEIINQYNQSDPEDLISIYHSSNVWVHDNYFQGQFHPGNGPGSSQNGITLDGYGGSGQPVNSNIIEDNIMVRTLGISVFPTTTGPASGNRFRRNRYTNAGYLDDGVTRNYYGYQGMGVKPGGTDNQAHDNVLGAMKGTSQGAYARGNDGEFSGEPRGNGNGSTTGAWADNTHMAPVGGTITRAMEDDEWDLWQQKLVDNSIDIGAENPTTPPSPPSGAAYFNPDISDGLARLPWTTMFSYTSPGYLDLGLYGARPASQTPDGRVAVVADPGGSGEKCIRFEIRNSDPPIGSNPWMKAEIRTITSYTLNKSASAEGDIRWFGFEIYLPYSGGGEQFNTIVSGADQFQTILDLHANAPGITQFSWYGSPQFIPLRVPNGFPNGYGQTGWFDLDAWRIYNADTSRYLANYNRWIPIQLGVRYGVGTGVATNGWVNLWVDGVNVIPERPTVTKWPGDNESYYKHGLYKAQSGSFGGNGISVLYYRRDKIGLTRAEVM